MSDLASLIERLEKATGPERLLDLDLLFVLEPERAHLGNGHYEPRPHRARRTDGGFHLYDENGKRGLWGDHVVPRYTASLDAVIALVEQKLPGWDGTAHGIFGCDNCSMQLSPPRAFPRKQPDDIWATAKTPAIALLIALLKALPPSPDNKGGT